MLKNSTLKFKEKYQPNTNYPHQKIACQTIPFLKTASSRKTFNSSMSCKKLQTNFASKEKINFNKTKQSFDTQVSEHKIYKQKLDNEATIKFKVNSSCSIALNGLKQQSMKSSVQKKEQIFIEQLPKNSLFYCCECFQYIFEIQKKRHYPLCKDKLVFTNNDRRQTFKIGWERIEKIVKLSQYTQTKTIEIEQLYKQIKRNEFSKIHQISYPYQSRFFTLQQIMEALTYTYQELLKGSVYKNQQILSCFQ